MNNNMGQKPNERPDMFKTSLGNNLPSNYIYGVDTNNKDEVLKAYKRLKRRHILFTILSFVVICGLGFLTYDFLRVNMWDKKPILGIKKKVEGGYVYKGIGYNAMYCDNGDIYKVNVDKQSCTGSEDDKTYKGILLKNFKIYLRENKFIDQDNLKSIEFKNITYDEDNEHDGVDYLVDIHLECNDGSASCMKVFKEVPNQNDVKLYLVLDRANEVVDVKTFKASGEYYKTIKEDYTEKVKKYMIANGMIDEENLRYFTVELFGNRGRYKFEDVIYADSYLISIDYFCHDNSNTCVQRFDNSLEFSNLTFDAAMFLNDDNEVGNLRSVQVIE